MRKWRKALIAAACLAAAILLSAFLAREKQPHYNGRSLSQWLATATAATQTQTPSEEAERSVEAVRAIGTNALPFLLKWLRHEPARWQLAALNATPGWMDKLSVRHLIDPREARANAAVAGFALLSSNAATAIPELHSMARDQTHPFAAIHALRALVSLGNWTLLSNWPPLVETNYPFKKPVRPTNTPAQ